MVWYRRFSSVHPKPYAVPHRGRGFAARLRLAGTVVDGGDKLRVALGLV